MKKVLMIFLSIALIFTMAAPVFAADNVNDKFAELKAAGVLSGDANGNMLPVGSEMQRQQLAKIACTLAGVSATPNVDIPAFADDYKTDVWGFDQGWIQAAYTNGLMLGKGDAGFDAKGTVTMAELLTVVLRAAGLGDELDNDNWKASAVQVALDNGFINISVDPDNVATYGDLVNQVYVSYETIQASKTFQVSSVSADNGRTVKIAFNKAADATTVISGGKLINVTFTAIGTAPAVTSAAADASLSADKKVLTITPTTSEFFNGDYAVNVAVAVKDVDGDAIAPYAAVVNLTDNVGPAVVSVTYPTANLAKVTFSEEIDETSSATLTAKLQVKHPISGSVVNLTGLVTLAADNKSFTINTITSPGPTTFSADMPTPYDLTLVGIVDYAGNMLNPNPTKVQIDPEAQDDTVNPSLVSIEALGVGVAKITFSEKMDASTLTLDVDGASVGFVNGTDFNMDSTGTVATTTGIGALTGTVKVEVGGNDLAGNAINTGFAGTPVNYKFVNFVPDTTAPKYVSSSLETIGADNYLLVKFDENVTVGTPGDPVVTGTYVDSSQITKTMTGINVADVSLHLVGAATVSDTIKVKVTSLVPGNYNVVLKAALVVDSATNSSLATNVAFTLGGFLDPTKPVATITTAPVPQFTEDIIEVTFDRVVTAATALNVANYKIEGNNIFASAIFDGDAKTVKLTLAPNTITIGGNYQMQVANVATAAGATMTPIDVAIPLKENVKPTFTKAELATTTTITASFSEKVTSATTNAFEVYKNGVKIATGVSSTAPTAADSVTITIPAVDLSANYTVKFVGTDYLDAAGNTTVSGNTVTLIK